jgi:hypothetical protein
MNREYSMILLTLVCLSALGIGAQAQDQNKVTVSVPYEFVAGCTLARRPDCGVDLARSAKA